MSTKRNWNNVELKVFIVRNYGNAAAFCRALGINLSSYNSWLRRNDPFPRMEAKIIGALKAKNYDMGLVLPSEVNMEVV